MTGLGALGVVAAVVMAYQLQMALASADEQLEHSAANTLLLCQQLESLNQLYVLSLPLGALSPTDIAAIRSWQPFDEQFITANADEDNLGYEVANVASRQGYHRMLLGDLLRCQELFSIADNGLDQLLIEIPGNIQYTMDKVGICVFRAKLASLAGHSDLAFKECENAVSLLETIEDRAIDLEERSPRAEFVELLLNLQEFELAKLMGEQHLAQLETRAQAEPGPSDALNERIAAAQQQLQRIVEATDQ